MEILRDGINAAVDKVRELAESDSSGPSTMGAAARNFGPPKVESGYYSTGRMQGFGSNSAPGRGYGNDSYRGGGGYGRDDDLPYGVRRSEPPPPRSERPMGGGGGTRWSEARGDDRYAASSYDSREDDRYAGTTTTQRLQQQARNTGGGGRSGFPGDYNGDLGASQQSSRFDDAPPYRNEEARQEIEQRSHRGYAVPGQGAPSYSQSRPPEPTSDRPGAFGPPKIESGYYSTGRMQGFGSDDLKRTGGYPPRGGGGGRDYQPGYIDRGPPRRPNNYDYNDDRAREERGETMAALVEASSRGVAAAVAAVSAASETIQKGYATNEPPTYYSGGGSGLLGSNGMGGLEPKGAGDNGDDGHGADAWMTTIEFDAQGNERFVDNSQPPPRRNVQPPSVPKPNLPKPSGAVRLPEAKRQTFHESLGQKPPQSMGRINLGEGRPSRPTSERPTRELPARPDKGRPRPTSGRPSNFGSAYAQPAAQEANLLDLSDPAEAEFLGRAQQPTTEQPSDAFAASFPTDSADPFGPSSDFGGPPSDFPPSNGAQQKQPAADPFGATFSSGPDDPFAPSTTTNSSPPAQPPPNMLDGPSGGNDLLALASPDDLTRNASSFAAAAGQSDMAMLGGVDLGASPSGARFAAAFEEPSEPPAVAQPAVDPKDPWAAALNSKVLNLGDITAPKNDPKAANSKPVGPMGQMKLEAITIKPKSPPTGGGNFTGAGSALGNLQAAMASSGIGGGPKMPSAMPPAQPAMPPAQPAMPPAQPAAMPPPNAGPGPPPSMTPDAFKAVAMAAATGGGEPPPPKNNFCTNCGAKRVGAGKFCANCGTKWPED